MKYQAEFRITVTVEFEDDGQHSLLDLAFEEVESKLDLLQPHVDVELIAGTLCPLSTHQEQSNG